MWLKDAHKQEVKKLKDLNVAYGNGSGSEHIQKMHDCRMEMLRVIEKHLNKLNKK